MQRSKGFDFTILSGEINYRDGESTNKYPCRLVRGNKSCQDEGHLVLKLMVDCLAIGGTI